jgi:uroporphyrinogen decarboxylase
MHRFLRACRREPVDRTPIWLMRQTGRYLPEFRAIRQKYSAAALWRNPDLAAEVTLQPLARFDLDAALLFSDVNLLLVPLGFELPDEEHDHVRPPTRLRSAEDISRLTPFDPREALPFVFETIRIVRNELDGHRPLLGFAASPFSLACQILEDRTQGSLAHVRALMYGESETWHRLSSVLAGIITDFLVAQVEAGADAVQLFESAAGSLSLADYERFALPYSRVVFHRLQTTGAATLHYGPGTGHLLEAMARAGGDVLGVDWRTPLDEAWQKVGPDLAIQGNLHPALLLDSMDELLAGVDDVLERAGGRPGHIFNLGQGLLPTTPLDRIDILTRHVHGRRR